MDLRRAGILLDSVTVDGAALLGRLDRGDFDMAALTWDGRQDEDPRLMLTGQGEFQYTGYRSDAFAALIDSVHAAASPAARAPILQELAALLGKDRPALFLYRHDVPAVASRRVHGLAAVEDRLDLRGVWVEP
jgi:ABC-type oligopeptide transport system substrate-binding subunit